MAFTSNDDDGHASQIREIYLYQFYDCARNLVVLQKKGQATLNEKERRVARKEKNKSRLQY